MIVLYTAILGESDLLKRAPRHADRCVCFTDDPLGVEDAYCNNPAFFTPRNAPAWDLRLWNITPDGARRDARRLRCGSTTLFPTAGITVWVDGSFEVLNFGKMIDDFRALNVDIASMQHPERTTCYDEGREIIRLGQASDAVVRAQLLEYERDGFTRPPALTTPGILIRRRTPQVEAFNRLWFSHIERFTDNDLISVDYCAWKVGLKIGLLEGSYPDNPYTTFNGEDHHARRRPYVAEAL